MKSTYLLKINNMLHVIGKALILPHIYGPCTNVVNL